MHGNRWEERKMIYQKKKKKEFYAPLTYTCATPSIRCFQNKFNAIKKSNVLASEESIDIAKA